MPPFQIAGAKLSPPATRPGTVPRTQLIGRLLEEPRRPIVSIIAPPGYGKTLLLAEWAARSQRQVAWLTLDRLDNDPSTFLSYLALAIDRARRVDDSLQLALAASVPRILATAVPRLASELHRWPEPGLLVLDDVHRLHDRTSLDALTELLDHLPVGFQVAMAARWEPDLPFGRFRAQRNLHEIGRDQLAFSEAETAALTAAAGRRLTPQEVHGLTARSEGWAAAIYLATLASERNAAHPRTAGEVSGRDDYIAEYLRAELGASLDDEDLTLLTRTAVLETVSPDVAEALVGSDTSGTRLAALARTFALIQPLESPDGSYRFHHLLREYLQAELERREPGVTPTLHRRAASWYAAAGRFDAAVDHLTAGGDLDGAAELVTTVALPTFYGGRVSMVDQWIRGFDDSVLVANPPLAVIAGWLHVLTGRAEAAGRVADLVDRATYAGRPADGAASFESSRAMLRAVMARHGLADMVANAELAAATEGPDSPWHANALWLLGSARLLEGDVAGADAGYAAAVDAMAATSGTAAVALAKRAAIALGRGDWSAAEGFIAESRAIIDRAHFGEFLPALIVHAVGARLAAQLGDRGRARDELVRAQRVRPLASYAGPWYSVDALLELARAYLAMSDPAGARSVVREAEEIARRRPDLGILDSELKEMRARLSEASAVLAGSSTLTAAELRLLPILSTYLSFQDIADRLGISRNTVKTQALSIYGKLQASSRGEAVERAVELGLLEPFPGLTLSGSRRTD